MNTYLVGGAVRDQLLGYPIKEHDWVVVGCTPEQLLQKGYKQVGHDFPVFLHPKTGEEYALARLERKKAPGYYGFTCDFSTTVTLEEDLARRDLTINAMAMDDKGQIIDPYGGQTDLNARVLRHVSDAFVEDPVRVLRVARFAARYCHLGFKLADETRHLMYQMVRQGELNHLVAERVWQEWYGSLQEKNPEEFINVLRSCGALRIVLPEIDNLFGVPNRAEYHPEIDTGVHTLMVLKVATQLSNDPLIRFAALLHDLGKAKTPMSVWPAQHAHEELGVKPIEDVCQRLRVPADYRKFACLVSRFHLIIHRLQELRATTIVKLFEQMDAFRRPVFFEKLLMVCEADSRGRTNKENAKYPQLEKWRFLLTECAKINARALVEQGLQGEAIKKQLHVQRLTCIKHLINRDINEK